MQETPEQKIERIKAQIAAGTYCTDAKLSIAMGMMVNELLAGEAVNEALKDVEMG